MTEIVLTQKLNTNNKVLEILFDNDNVTWKNLIFGLIESEDMNPWDIDISIIANKFLSTLKTLKNMDFRVSGKIILASAILLKLKTNKLLTEDITALNNMINDDIEEDYLEEIEEYNEKETKEKPELIVKTPQPRKRKVSVYDLVEALSTILDSKPKKIIKKRSAYKELQKPEYTDVSELIKEVYNRINNHFQSTPKQKLTFTDIIPSDNKEDKVMTFIPLLHLDTKRKIDLLQEEHFGEININLLEKNSNLEELSIIAETAIN